MRTILVCHRILRENVELGSVPQNSSVVIFESIEFTIKAQSHKD